MSFLDRPVLRRLVHPIYRRLETDVHPLRYLFLEITQRCNLNCLHCGSDCGSAPRSEELTLKDWLGLFHYVKQNFDVEKLMAVVTGGEPLCRPDFAKVAAGLRDEGLKWGMVTNGYLLDDSAIRLLKEDRLSSMTISLDGLEDNHDWLRGRRGSFKRAVAGIGRAVEAGFPLFDVVTCVNPRNLPELDQVMAFLMDKGVSYWRLFLIFPKGRAAKNEELILSVSETRDLIVWISRTRRRLKGSGFHVDFCCEGYFPADVDRAIRDEPYFCRAGIAIGSVLSDGAISACPNVSRSLIQGNVKTDDLRTVWEERFGPFRERDWMRKGPCLDCGQWRRCQGNSMHLWDDEKEETVRCFYKLLKT